MALNKTQKKELKAIADFLSEHLDFINDLATNKREAYENKSDRWKEGDKGQEASEECDQLDSLQTNYETLHEEMQGMDLWEDA